ncbi:MAG: VOC family protein [Azospirillaceae bacterium]
MPTAPDRAAAGLALDHVFVCTTPDGPEAAMLADLGLVASYRRAHPGQGTANACWCFDNAYLELLWAAPETGPVDPTVRRTRLAERIAWRETGASPFGIAVRTEPADAPLPFETWAYRPPYLPPGLSIPVAVDSDDPRRPFVFRSPGSARPDAWTDGRAGDRQRAEGLGEITGLHLSLPDEPAPGPALETLAAAGLLTLETGARTPRLDLAIARRDGGAPLVVSLPAPG